MHTATKMCWSEFVIVGFIFRVKRDIFYIDIICNNFAFFFVSCQCMCSVWCAVSFFCHVNANLTTLVNFAVRFQIAHLYEVQNKYKAAKEAYGQLLEEKQLTPQLRSDIFRQLGWMYHCIDSLGDKRQRETYAITYLQKSIQADPKSGQSLYLLGRCFAGINKVHDAFIAYRNSVEKSEGNADTWCSIGYVKLCDDLNYDFMIDVVRGIGLYLIHLFFFIICVLTEFYISNRISLWMRSKRTFVPYN